MLKLDYSEQEHDNYEVVDCLYGKSDIVKYVGQPIETISITLVFDCKEDAVAYCENIADNAATKIQIVDVLNRTWECIVTSLVLTCDHFFYVDIVALGSKDRPLRMMSVSLESETPDIDITLDIPEFETPEISTFRTAIDRRRLWPTNPADGSQYQLTTTRKYVLSSDMRTVTRRRSCSPLF